MDKFNVKVSKTACCLAVVLLMLVLPFLNQKVYAHQYSSSLTTITLTKSHTELTFAIDELSAIELATGDRIDNDGKLNQKQFNSLKDQLESVIKRNLNLQINGEPMPWPRLESFVLDRKGKAAKVELKALFPPVSANQSFSIIDQLYLEDTATNYVNLVTVNYGSQTNTAAITRHYRDWVMVLSEDDYVGLSEDAGQMQTGDQWPQHPSAPQSKSASGWYSFFHLGMLHILTGYDHLLFLFSLIIAKQSFKQYAALITAFTISHSFTLTLAVLDIANVPAWIVEPAIALSICYVAVENMLRKTWNRRWMLTFAFGLIHGLGFADILKEMDIPKKELAVDLISFNMGIEAVQLTIVSAALPLIYFLYRWKHARWAMLAGSAATLILGGAWFIQRVF